MHMHRKSIVVAFLSIFVVIGLGCSLASAVSPAAPPNTTIPPTLPAATQAQAATEAPPEDAGAVPAAAGSVTPPPLAATIMASQHAMKPADAVPAGSQHYDVDSSVTAPENRPP